MNQSQHFIFNNNNINTKRESERCRAFFLLVFEENENQQQLRKHLRK